MFKTKRQSVLVKMHLRLKENVLAFFFKRKDVFPGYLKLLILKQLLYPAK